MFKLKFRDQLSILIYKIFYLDMDMYHKFLKIYLVFP